MAKSIDIPQDIIDSVIAAVGDDTQLLKQCSLVSTSFLLPSRKHLFSRITITNDETFQEFHQFFVQNPVVQTFVRAIAWHITPERKNDTSLLAILRLPFCCLESFSIASRDEDDGDMIFMISEDWWPGLLDWNSFSGELKDALSNIILSSSLKTLSFEGITNIPTTLLLDIAHLTTLELISLTPNDFCYENSSSLTLAALKGEAPVASDIVVDRCVWRYGYEQSHRSIDLIFLPFMGRLRFLEIHLNLCAGTEHDFKILSFLISSLSISLTSPERLEFNIRFHGYSIFNSNTFYESSRTAWSRLDAISTHPTSARLQRVDININYVLHHEHDGGEEPNKDKISKAILEGLPLLFKKDILFVEVAFVK